MNLQVNHFVKDTANLLAKKIELRKCHSVLRITQIIAKNHVTERISKNVKGKDSNKKRGVLRGIKFVASHSN